MGCCQSKNYPKLIIFLTGLQTENQSKILNELEYIYLKSYKHYMYLLKLDDGTIKNGQTNESKNEIINDEIQVILKRDINIHGKRRYINILNRNNNNFLKYNDVLMDGYLECSAPTDIKLLILKYIILNVNAIQISYNDSFHISIFDSSHFSKLYYNHSLTHDDETYIHVLDITKFIDNNDGMNELNYFDSIVKKWKRDYIECLKLFTNIQRMTLFASHYHLPLRSKICWLVNIDKLQKILSNNDNICYKDINIMKEYKNELYFMDEKLDYRHLISAVESNIQRIFKKHFNSNEYSLNVILNDTSLESTFEQSCQIMIQNYNEIKQLSHKIV